MFMEEPWYEYIVTEEQSDKTERIQKKEKFVVKSVTDDEVVFERFTDGKANGEYKGKTSYANWLIRNDDLSKVAEEEIDTPTYGKRKLDVFGSDRCGGSTTVWQDGLGLMYRAVQSQMWSKGIIYKKTFELINFG
jgi:hypothetical protein